MVEHVMTFLTPIQSIKKARNGETTILAETASMGRYDASSNVIGIDDEFEIRYGMNGEVHEKNKP